MSDANYRERMQRKKEAIDRRVAAASTDKGILVALIGEGLGKSSSAYGMAARTLGHGLRCAVARFAGGDDGETRFLRAASGVDPRTHGSEPAITPEWLAGCLSDPEVNVVILDGIDAAIERGLIEGDALAQWLRERPDDQHVVVTGTRVPDACMAMADTITEMRDAKRVLDSVADRAEATEADFDQASGRAWQEIDRLDAPGGQGRLLIHTGNGKGKSSAAFGKAIRALGHGRRVGIVQFIKGNFTTGERLLFDGHPGVVYRVMGQGFTWETQDRSRDHSSADAAWAEARTLLADPDLDLVILDELNNAIKKELVDLGEVLGALQARPAHQDVIVTGRNARPALMNAADAVTQVHKQRHAFEGGFRAQNGIDL